MKKIGTWIMKYILRPIGRFFAAIGRWIRDTAWVQPLLIVGAIFAIIFSIPSLVKWINTIGKKDEDTEVFYRNRELEFEGLTKDDYLDSEVGLFFSKLETALDQVESNDLAGARASMKAYGDKFFLSFVQSGCSACENMKDAFEAFKDISKAPKFELHSVFVDTVIEDDDDSNFINNTPFETLFDISPLSSVLEQAAEEAENRPFYANLSASALAVYRRNLDNMLDTEQFQTPTTILFDFTDAAAEKQIAGISQIIFAVEPKGSVGSDNVRRANTLIDAWNGEGEFADK